MSTALVCVPSTPQQTAVPRANIGASADFIAHLIATSQRMPQTRMRRRAEPALAVSAYRALGHWPTPSGRALSRSL
jgi:hypothetical protein